MHNLFSYIYGVKSLNYKSGDFYTIDVFKYFAPFSYEKMYKHFNFNIFNSFNESAFQYANFQTIDVAELIKSVDLLVRNYYRILFQRKFAITYQAHPNRRFLLQ